MTGTKQSWQVTYEATYWVQASTEEEAIDLAIDKHYELPDGDWSAELEQFPPLVEGAE
jgi:hypothetical protein